MSKFDFSIYQNSNSYQQANKSNDFTKEFYIKDGDTLTLSKALEFDNCPAKYINGYRKGENFQISNCILADIDNTHSDNESEWITHEDVKKALPDITFYYYPSRNNMKVKNDKSVDFVDDLATVFCKFDNGRRLGLAYGADSYRRMLR